MRRPSYPRRVSGVETRPKDDEVLLVRRADEPGVVLNRSAGAIWELCDGGRTVEGISGELERLLSLPEGALLEDVSDAVAEFSRCGLVVLDSEEVSGGDAAPGTPRAGTSWRDVARPREDLADLEAALSQFAAIAPKSHRRYLARGARSEDAALLSGSLALRRCYERLDTPLEDAPTDHPNLAAAEAWLSVWPVGRAQVVRWMRVLHPLIDPRQPADATGFMVGSACHSDDSPPFLGTMWSTVNCPFMLAENLVHELAHQKLFALGIRKESTRGWITNTDEHVYRSPIITDRLRPMTALVHGVYAYLYVTAFDVAALRHEIGERARPPVLDSLRRRLTVNLDRIRRGVREIREHLFTDADGAEFFAGYFDWFEELESDAEAALAAAPTDAPRPPRARVRDTVRIFVGTDPQQRRAEIALEESIRRTVSGPYEITWMNHALGGLWSDWRIGRERGALPTNGGPGWATEFTGFRFAVPEAAGFRGRGIYLDVDMLALRDLRELFEQPMPRPWLTTPNCASVMLVDCAYFRGKAWWPGVDELRRTVAVKKHCTTILKQRDLLGKLDPRWNCLDGKRFRAGETGILHFTARATQPWRPYPEIFRYSPHPRIDMEELWWEAYSAGVRRTDAPASTSASPRSSEDPSPEHGRRLDAFRALHLRTHAAVLGSPHAGACCGDGLLAHADNVRRLVRDTGSETLLDFGCGKGLQYAATLEHLNGLLRSRGAEPLDDDGLGQSLAEWWGVRELVCHDPAYPPLSARPRGPFDGVVCTDVLEYCAEEDVDWILAELFAAARRFVYVGIGAARDSVAAGEGSPVPRIARPPAWWTAKVFAAAEPRGDARFTLRVGNVSVSSR